MDDYIVLDRREVVIAGAACASWPDRWPTRDCVPRRYGCPGSTAGHITYRNRRSRRVGENRADRSALQTYARPLRHRVPYQRYLYAGRRSVSDPFGGLGCYLAVDIVPILILRLRHNRSKRRLIRSRSGAAPPPGRTSDKRSFLTARRDWLRKSGFPAEILYRNSSS